MFSYQLLFCANAFVRLHQQRWRYSLCTAPLARSQPHQSRIPSAIPGLQRTARSANHTTECSSMRTARPAARPPHPFFELRAHPFDMLPPCLIFLDGDGPADPLVARERRYVFPSRQCLRVRRDRFSEISRKVMYDASGDSNGFHRLIPQIDGSHSH